MAKDPAFLFYSNDFLTGTYLMTDEQVGQYIRLMCLQHQKGHLTEKDMLKICGKEDKEVYSKFMQDEEGLYYNKRLEEEANKRKAFTESRRNNRNKVDNSNTNVYLIKDNINNVVKIGSSNNPERRLVELKNQYKNDSLTIIALAKNVPQTIEKELHDKYADKNKINEWFYLNEKDISNIICTYHMINHMENENEIENINLNNNNKIKEFKKPKSNNAYVNENQSEFNNLERFYN